MIQNDTVHTGPRTYRTYAQECMLHASPYTPHVSPYTPRARNNVCCMPAPTPRANLGVFQTSFYILGPFHVFF